MKSEAPHRRDGIWTDFNSRAHEHILSGESEIALCEAIHNIQPDDVWTKQLVLNTKCTPLHLKGGDAVVSHVVAADRGEGQSGEPSRQLGERFDITENSVGELGATHGCRGCLDSVVTSTEACHAKLTSAC